jgi:hypothetical protein
MIRSLRAFFLGRLLREKLLLLVFIAFGLVWWLFGFSARGSRFWRQEKATTVALRDQDWWISRRTIIDDAAKKAASQLDRSQTLDSVRLVNAVNKAAYDAGLRNNYITASAGQETNGMFTIHSATCTVSKATYDILQTFYKNLQARAPYIGIEQFALLADRGANPPGSTLSLQLKVSSVEVAP